MPNVVLVIDMVKGFLEPGHNLDCGEESREIIPRVYGLLEREWATGSDILFISDHHDPDDLEFQLFPVHCVKGTSEPDVIPELNGFLAGDNMIPKNRYSGFFDTPLEAKLANMNPEKIIICGVCTDICVLHTASDARNRDYSVEVPADCVASFKHDAHEWALSHLKDILGVKVV